MEEGVGGETNRCVCKLMYINRLIKDVNGMRERLEKEKNRRLKKNREE